MDAPESSFNNYFASKRIQQTPYYLIILLTFNMIVVLGVTIMLLYTLGLNRQKDRLKELVETQAVMINVIVQQERLIHPSPSSAMQKKMTENIIRKVSHAHYRYVGFGRTGEFILGKREGDTIQFLTKQRHFDLNTPTSVPWKSHLGEPMRRALNGTEGGADILFDYRGEVVLAAYKPIKDLEWGIVAKIDLSEIRAPYIEAATYAFGLTLLLAFAGSLVFWYFLHPMVQTIEDSRHFNRILITNSSAGLALCSLDGIIVDANNSFLAIIECTGERIGHIHYFDLIAQEYLEHEIRQFETLKQNGTIEPYESVYLNRTGERTCVKISGKVISIKGLLYVWLSVDNIQNYKQREAELLLSDAVFHSTSEVIFITDASKKIIKVNEAFSTVTGFAPEEVLGQNPRILKSGKHDAHFYEEMFKTIHATGKWYGEIWNQRRDGTLFPSLQSISAIYNEKGELIRYVSVLSDITLQKAYEQQLLIDSHHDALTGLPNRLFLDQMLTQTLARSQRGQKQFAIFFIDLNRFKEVNDTYGHEVGDTLLKTVATRLHENIRSDDFIARLGGDEFTVIFESIRQKEEAITLAQTLIMKTNQPFVIDDVELIPSISIGIALYPETRQ